MKKCSIIHGKITLCKKLNHLLENHDSKIEKITMVSASNLSDEFIGGISFRYGRKKNDIFNLSFCPVCGGNLV